VSAEKVDQVRFDGKVFDLPPLKSLPSSCDLHKDLELRAHVPGVHQLGKRNFILATLVRPGSAYEVFTVGTGCPGRIHGEDDNSAVYVTLDGPNIAGDASTREGDSGAPYIVEDGRIFAFHGGVNATDSNEGYAVTEAFLSLFDINF
jgi:hypothetical protein